mmetsp:Transcript_20868/g.39674  ORF Transcript_20868/g.39674 Transcript_20868/m.39674 type:complete len:140 (-) Transcript_20868:988-1407(-)
MQIATPAPSSRRDARTYVLGTAAGAGVKPLSAPSWRKAPRICVRRMAEAAGASTKEDATSPQQAQRSFARPTGGASDACTRKDAPSQHREAPGGAWRMAEAAGASMLAAPASSSPPLTFAESMAGCVSAPRKDANNLPS